jgi:hypothetical protein
MRFTNQHYNFKLVKPFYPSNLCFWLHITMNFIRQNVTSNIQSGTGHSEDLLAFNLSSEVMLL